MTYAINADGTRFLANIHGPCTGLVPTINEAYMLVHDLEGMADVLLDIAWNTQVTATIAEDARARYNDTRERIKHINTLIDAAKRYQYDERERELRALAGRMTQGIVRQAIEDSI